MKTITINLYQFNELSEEAKRKAVENLYDINVDFNWWDSTYEDAKNIGLKITGFDLERGNYCNGEFLLSANEVAQNIFNNHGENCETHKTAEKFMELWQPVFDEYMKTEEGESELINLESEFLNDLLEDYKTMLNKDYDYLTSKEGIIETIEAIECDFTIDGKLY